MFSCERRSHLTCLWTEEEERRANARWTLHSFLYSLIWQSMRSNLMFLLPHRPPPWWAEPSTWSATWALAWSCLLLDSKVTAMKNTVRIYKPYLNIKNHLLVFFVSERHWTILLYTVYQSLPGLYVQWVLVEHILCVCVCDEHYENPWWVRSSLQHQRATTLQERQFSEQFSTKGFVFISIVH